MPVVNKYMLGGGVSAFTREVDGPADHAAVEANTYFRDKSDGLIRYKNASNTIIDTYVPSVVIEATNTLYVSTSGNNSTGVRNEPSRPFLTLEAARDAASNNDVIMVYPGNYTVTTTDVNGLLVEAVHWYFYPNTTVTKTTAGVMFYNRAGFSSPANVYGYGNFNMTSVAGGIAVYQSENSAVFEANSLSSDGAFFAINLTNGDNLVTIRTLLTNTVGGCIQIETTTTANLNRAVGGTSCVNKSGNNSVILNASSLNSSGSTLVVSDSCHINASRIIGTIGFSSGLVAGSIVLNVNYINTMVVGNAQHVSFNGYCTNLTINTLGTYVTGGTYDIVIVNNGYASITMDETPTKTITATVNAGVAHIRMRRFGTTQGAVVVTGGDVTVYGPSNFQGATWTIGNVCSLSSGTLRLRGDFTFNTLVNYVINMTGGVLDLGNSKFTFIAAATASSYNYLVNYVSGSCIVNGATFVQTTNSWPIIATNPGLVTKVLSGGLNINKTTSMLAARTERETITVTPGSTSGRFFVKDLAATPLSTNIYEPGPLANDVAVAASLASILNLTPLNITAVHIPGNAFITIEADTTAFSVITDTFTNVSSVVTRQTSYIMTNPTGGSEINSLLVE